MPRRAASFTEHDIKRAARGAQAAGLIVDRIEIEGAKIVVFAAGAKPGQSANSFDRLLDETA